MTQVHSLSAALHANSAAAVLGHATERMLEGRYRWGSIDVTPTGRTSWSRTRLTIYPPGTNHTERRALQLYRTWPVLGAVVGLLALLAFSSWGVGAATATATGIYAVGLFVAYTMTRSLRPRLKTVTVVRVLIGGGFEDLGDVTFYGSATDEFRALDALDARGLVTPAEYENRWAQIYNAIP